MSLDVCGIFKSRKMGPLILTFVMLILDSNVLSKCLWAQEGSQKKVPEIELPADNEKPIVVYDLTGGYRAKYPDGFKPEPMLQIFPDGRVIAGRNNPQVARSQWKMPADELQQLLQRIVKERDFFEASTEEIAKQIKATGKKVLLADAGTSEITVNLPQGSQTVSAYALSFSAKQFREIAPLVDLAATDEELKMLRHRASLGSDEQAAILLTEINEAFAEEFPGIGKFALSDLRSAYRRSEGSLKISMRRDFESKVGPQSFRVSFEQASAEEDPKIKFYHKNR